MTSLYICVLFFTRHVGFSIFKVFIVCIRRTIRSECCITGLLQGEHPEILAQSHPPPVDLNLGDIRSQIAAEWSQIVQRSKWTAYRKPPSLFRMVPSLTSTTSHSPKNGFYMPPRHANGHISATGDPIHFTFGSRVGFSGSVDRMAQFPVTSNPSWRQAAILDNFEWRYLRNGSFDPLIQRALRGHLCDSITFLLLFEFKRISDAFSGDFCEPWL